MTEERQLVRVSFRKQVSDGNYGTESAEVTLEDSAEAEDLLDQAREYVHAELAKSPSKAVRQTVNPPRKLEPPAPTADPEDLPF